MPAGPPSTFSGSRLTKPPEIKFSSASLLPLESKHQDISTRTTSFIYKGQCGRWGGGGKPHGHPLWIAEAVFPLGEKAAPCTSTFSATSSEQLREAVGRRGAGVPSPPCAGRVSSVQFRTHGGPHTLSLPSSNRTFRPGRKTVKDPKAGGCRGKRPLLCPPTASRGPRPWLPGPCALLPWASPPASLGGRQRAPTYCTHAHC